MQLFNSFNHTSDSRWSNLVWCLLVRSQIHSNFRLATQLKNWGEKNQLQMEISWGRPYVWAWTNLKPKITWIEKVRARIKPHPNTEMRPMLERIAIGPLISAPLVSSVKCAAASYPYREYWLTNQERRMAYAPLLIPVVASPSSKWVNT